MITLRPASARGAGEFGWLSSRHSFSFGHYFDPAHMGFRSLRVINEDRIAPSAGFPTHGHHDMEILSYVLAGALEHKDSMGNGTIIRPGEVQIMSAGTGVRHSEFNPSASEPAHFLQIWIETEAKGATPRYEQKAFPVAERRGRLRLVASRDGREGSVTLRQDAALYAGLVGVGETLRHSFAAGRHGWVQVVRGQVSLDGQTLAAGDGVAVSDVPEITLTAAAPGSSGEAEVLVFDLA